MQQQIEQSEVVLISSKIKTNKLMYEVEKEGVIFLRNLKNKKFRIIFNVLPLKNKFQSSQKLSKKSLNQNESILDQSNIKILSEFNKLLLKQSAENQSKYYQNQQAKHYNQSKSHLNSKAYNLQQNESYLTISKNIKQLQKNRIIVIFNAYINQKEPPNLVIFAYLIASVIFYHNWNNQFSQSSHLTKMLVEIGKILKKTKIDKLTQNIKFKTGYQKTPYFMCLLGIHKPINSNRQKSQIDYKSYFNEFYRFQSQNQNSKINCALQTIIDYFPNRSSLGIEAAKIQENKHIKESPFIENGVKTILDIGNQFEKQIVGRQLFNFEFTGSTIENLSFQMCQFFNNQEMINLVDIYDKVILNQKSRVLDQCTKFYVKNLEKQIFYNKNVSFGQNYKQSGEHKQIKSILPISDMQLSKKLKYIKQKTFNQTAIESLNCMNLQQYLIMKQKLSQRISKYQDKISKLNNQQGFKFVNECFQILDFDQNQSQFKQIEASINFNNQFNEYASNLPDFLLGKIQSFSNECIGLLAQDDKSASAFNQTFLRLIRNYFSKIKFIMNQIINTSQMNSRKDKLQIDTLNYELKRVTAQKKKIEEQYQLQLMIVEQYKNKLQKYMLQQNLNLSTQQQSILNQSSFSKSQTSLMIKSESFLSKKYPQIMLKKSSQSFTYNNSKQYYKMKKQIQQLLQQVKDKNNHIQDLLQILQKFQSTSKVASSLNLSSLNPIQKKTDKFNQQTLKLINQANSKIMKFYQIIQEVKNVQKQYENLKKQLLKEKQKIMNQKKQSLKQIMNLKTINQNVKFQNSKLQQIISEQKKTIQKYQELKQTLNKIIEETQSKNGQLTCSFAQTQSQMQVYRKALTLVIQQYAKGKSQNLSKFYKFLEHAQLKEILKPIIKK